MSADRAVRDLARASRTSIGREPNARVQGISRQDRSVRRARCPIEHLDGTPHASFLAHPPIANTHPGLGAARSRPIRTRIAANNALGPLLEAGNRAGIRRACEDLLRTFGNTTDPAQANSVARSCVLAPNAVADREAPERLAEAALAGHPEGGRPRSAVLTTLGAALYRAGRFEDANRRLDESIQARGDGGDPKGSAFLALAHHRLGRRDEVNRWHDKLVAYRTEEGFDLSRDDVEIRILHREAESLILGSSPTAAPIAPATPARNAIGDPGAELE